MRRFSVILLCLFAAVVVAENVSAQRMPERRLVRRGNRQFDKMNFDRAAGFYTRALEADTTSFEAVYNLGNALFRSERLEGAEQALACAAADTTRTDAERAEAFFNLGDVQFSRQNLQGALESFKNALRLNPSDMEAKYNYAYTKKLLEQQQDDQDNQDNKDNQNNNDDRDQNGGGGGGGGQDQNQNQDRNDSGDEPNEGDGDGRQQPSGISPEQLEAMLDAIQAQEDKTQDKVNEKKAVVVRGRKNW